MTEQAASTGRFGPRPRRRAHSPRWRRLATVCAVSACFTVASVTAGGAAGASSAPRDHLWGAAVHHSSRRATPSILGAGPVHYAVDKPACGKARPGTATCFALRRVPVAKGTPGAYAYTSPAYQKGPVGGYTPKDLAKAYGYNPTINRRSNIVGIIDWYDDPHALSDLNHFDKNYGFRPETSRSFRKVNQEGKTKRLPRPNVGTSTEIALDVESVRAVCHTCRILLVEAKSGTSANLAKAVNTAARLGASEISNSYGLVEGKLPKSVLNAYNHPGVVITASTGDSGWYGWDVANSGTPGPSRAQFPAVSPYVVSVGGTAMSLNSNGTRDQEDVWNENGLDDQTGVQYGTQGAAGGGCSKRFAAPPWQSHHAGYTAAGCKGGRLTADISALADPQTGFDIYDTYVKAGTKKWGTTGGTSLASPLIAAMYALAGGAKGAAYPAASLYTNASVRSSSLFDVVAGGNGFCGGDTTLNCGNDTYEYTQSSANPTHNPNGVGGGELDCSFPRNGSDPTSAPALSSECNAVTGYDGASGLGTPKSLKLFTSTAAKLSISRPKHLKRKHSEKFVAHAHQRVAHTHAVEFFWSFGDGKTASGKSGKIHHTYSKPGHYVVSLVEADSRYQYAVTVTRVVVAK